MPEEGIACHPRKNILSFEEIVRMVEILKTAYRIEKIRLTGGEPLLRKNIVDLITMLNKLDIPDLALTTNGQELAPLADKLKNAGLQRINISLDTLNSERYHTITHGGRLEHTLEGIDAALAAGLHPVKLNAVVLRSVNDDEIINLLKFAMEKGCEQRFLEIMPIGHSIDLHRINFMPADAILEIIRRHFTLEMIGRGTGSSAIRYRIATPDGHAAGTLGIIAPCTAPFCADCHRLRVTPDGMLVGCLACATTIPIRDKINTPKAFLQKVHTALAKKRTDISFTQPNLMATIGG